MQKAVRRGEVRAAVQCAVEMMRKRDKRGNTGFNMLVRRVPVISIEDAVFHRDLPLVVWLVVATSKGFEPCIALADIDNDGRSAVVTRAWLRTERRGGRREMGGLSCSIPWFGERRSCVRPTGWQDRMH